MNRRSSDGDRSVTLGAAIAAALEGCDEAVGSAVGHGVVGLAGVTRGRDVLAEVQTV